MIGMLGWVRIVLVGVPLNCVWMNMRSEAPKNETDSKSTMVFLMDTGKDTGDDEVQDENEKLTFTVVFVG